MIWVYDWGESALERWITITTHSPTGEVDAVDEGTTGPPARTRRRRPVRRVATVLAATGVAAAMAVGTLWYVAVPHYRPPLKAGEKYGIDVSNHQGRIDWIRVSAHDISYAYIKATEGNDFIDKRFRENWAGAQRAGVTRGAYHFFTLCSSGASQAANFLKVLPADANTLPPAVDLEFAACPKRPSNPTFQRELSTFVDTVERATGQEVVIYVMPNFEKRYPIGATVPRDRWERKLFRRPPSKDWTVWQVSAKAKVAGIGEAVDLDVWRGEVLRP
jgi:lysozyme